HPRKLLKTAPRAAGLRPRARDETRIREECMSRDINKGRVALLIDDFDERARRETDFDPAEAAAFVVLMVRHERDAAPALGLDDIKQFFGRECSVGHRPGPG